MTRANCSCRSLSKERKEQFAPIALFKRETRAKEPIPNPAQYHTAGGEHSSISAYSETLNSDTLALPVKTGRMVGMVGLER